MKIDYVIVSTDNNELYDGYWEIIKEAWIKIVGATPILVSVGDNDFFEKYSDHILIGYKKVEGIETSFQSQIARIFATSLYDDKTFLISDLDMIPLSKSYFVDNANEVNDDSILIYTSDAYGYNNQIRYPMCYNLAKGKTFKEILDINKSFEEFVKDLKLLNLSWDYPLWDTDELYIGKCINKFEQINSNRIVKLQRGFREGYATKRIDRDYWFNVNYDFKKISEEYYIDSHLLRPYKQHKIEIDRLISHLYS
jgi:hypothetical protein